MWNFDINLQFGYCCATIDPHVDIFALDRNLTRDGRQNLGLQNRKQIGLAACHALVGQEDLKSLPRHWRGTATAE